MKFIKLLLLTAILLTTFSAFSFAQDDDTIRVETNLVTINVAVTDKSGNYIKGLRREDFEIWDNRIKQRSKLFRRKTRPFHSASFMICTRQPTSARRLFWTQFANLPKICGKKTISL